MANHNPSNPLLTTVQVRPVPDPTQLTTEQLHREIEWVRQALNEYVETNERRVEERKQWFSSLITGVDERLTDRIDAAIREMHLLAESAKEAVHKSETAYDKRFESVNEFRAQLSDAASRYMTQAESRALHAGTAERLNAIMTRLDRYEGRVAGLDTGRTDVRANIIAVVGVLCGLASLFLFLGQLNSKVEKNTEARASLQESAKVPTEKGP